LINANNQKPNQPTNYFFEKFGQNKKSAYLCSPFAKKAGSDKKSAKRYASPAIELEVKDDGSIIFFKANKQTKENRGKKPISTPVV